MAGIRQLPCTGVCSFQVCQILELFVYFKKNVLLNYEVGF
jgi:hypothetical protein